MKGMDGISPCSRWEINIMVFAFFSLLITYLSLKLPDRIYDYRSWFYRERKWERRGRIYQSLFRVKAWKNRMPELSDFVKSVYPKKHIGKYSRKNLTVYLKESCRAELTHAAIICSSLLFRFWNDIVDTLIVLLIAFLINMPYIIIQRYNRPRITAMLEYV